MNNFKNIGGILSLIGIAFIMFAFVGLFLHDHQNFKSLLQSEKEIARLDSIIGNLSTSKLDTNTEIITSSNRESLRKIANDTIQIIRYLPCPENVENKKLKSFQDSIIILNQLILDYQDKLKNHENKFTPSETTELSEIVYKLCVLNNFIEGTKYEKELWYKHWLKLLPPQNLRSFCIDFEPYYNKKYKD